MAKIIVKNGDWDQARAQLKTALDAQNANFEAQFRAVFPDRPSLAKSPASAAKPQAPTESAPARKRAAPILARSRRHF